MVYSEEQWKVSETQLDVEEIPSCVSQLHIRTYSQSIPCCSLTPTSKHAPIAFIFSQNLLKDTMLPSFTHSRICVRTSGWKKNPRDYVFWLLCWRQAGVLYGSNTLFWFERIEVTTVDKWTNRFPRTTPVMNRVNHSQTGMNSLLW